MELLTIKHEDFEMTIECTRFENIWNKAKNNIGKNNLLTTYSWSEGVTAVVRKNINNQDILIEQGQQVPAIFFDNTDYPIWVEFNNDVTNAQFGSILQSENERFTFRRQILAGFLNYRNDIGRSEIKLSYKVDHEFRQFTFSFEVLSTKLNYHEHWHTIIEDIEREYKMLSLDYMRRTFHGFSPDSEGEKPEIVWWSIFACEQKKFIQACKTIIERPRHRLHKQKVYHKADKLKFVSSRIENELVEYRNETAHLYKAEEQVHTNDTQENRFLKFALNQIVEKYTLLKKRIENIKNTSDIMREELQIMQNSLKYLQHHSFFRTIGQYKGMNQENIVLQKAVGYNQVYRTWNMLRRAYSLNDGIYKLQTKDIATLYEIWCFIEVSHIVKEQLHLEDTDVDHRNRMEMNGAFKWELGKGEYSRILFKKDGIELAELVYNPQSIGRENDFVGVKNLVVPTVSQKPDIVLQLTKNDIEKGMKMTYLFDAKYRIDGKVQGVDVPPADAINQMHRYRDAIYYKQNQDDALKKEVVGGYILFPGDGEPADVEVSRFFKTIDEVNIGAFPLRPKDVRNRQLLEKFIDGLIKTKSSDTISRVIHQKGAFVEVGNRVLIGLVKNSSRKGYTQSFIDGTATLYYTGPLFPTTIALQNLHYFIPYIKGEGIRDIYEIIRVRTITSKEAKQIEGDEMERNDIRLAFELRFIKKHYANYQSVDTKRFSNNTFLDTTFEKLDEYVI
ncbi:MAG: DUF2357 domain-containing protein [Tannerellaceae bacterium]